MSDEEYRLGWDGARRHIANGEPYEIGVELEAPLPAVKGYREAWRMYGPTPGEITTEHGDTVSVYVSQYGKATMQIIGGNCSEDDVEVIASFTPGELAALVDLLTAVGAKSR